MAECVLVSGERAMKLRWFIVAPGKWNVIATMDGLHTRDLNLMPKWVDKFWDRVNPWWKL